MLPVEGRNSMHMTLLDGSELIVGIVVIALTFAAGIALRRRNIEAPSALGMALIPVTLLVAFVSGVVLILTGINFL
jgi:hypothetical protein